MSKQKKNIIAIVLFFAIFGGLLIIATFTDLQVSHILTKNALPAGAYYATDYFGVVFECCGGLATYWMLAFCAQVLFWYTVKFWKNSFLKTVAGVVTVAASTYAYWVYFSKAVGYIARHIGADDMTDHQKVVYKLVCIFFALLMTAAALPAVKNIKEEQLHKMLFFVFAFVCTAIVASLLVDGLKVPVGRMRYRAMNCEGGQSIGGFDNFTRWYVVNGQKYSNDEMNTLFGTTDACKSFPSGHTSAAAMSYGLIMLIDCLDIKKKWQKALLWIVPVIYTGIVAVSRIVVGAHFFSDVLFGGTIAFVCVIIFREIFVCKFSNVKIIFGKAQKS